MMTLWIRRSSTFSLVNKNIPKDVNRNGWGKRIRTFGMSESESDALPLGDTPIYLESQRTYYIIIDAQE